MAEKNKIQLDSDIISTARSIGESLKSAAASRNALFEEMDKIYFMDWTTQSNDKDIQVTISPDGRNAVNGAKRLLTTMEPVWSITVEGKDEEDTDNMENAAKIMWDRAGGQNQKPPHYDIVSSMLLYDEVHIAISSLIEYSKRLKGSKKLRVEDAMKQSPFTIKVWNPKDGYPYYDDIGLAGYYRSVGMTVASATKEYGQEVGNQLEKKGKKPTDTVNLDMWYDLDSFIIWIGGDVVVAEKWTLPFLPVSVVIGDGSGLFQDGAKNHNPLLYSMYKSGLWDRQCSSMTGMYTNLMRYALKPSHEHKLGQFNQDGAKQLDVDYDIGVVITPYGDSYNPILNKGVIDPALAAGMELAERKMEESTIFRTVFGQSLGSNATFSETSLLSQSGRLPLIVVKLMSGIAISKTIEKALRWYKEIGTECPGIGLVPSDIPETFEIDVNLEIDVPQDKLQNANVAGMLTDKGMTSKKWAQKNLLQIENSKQMDKDIWTERAQDLMVMKVLEEMSQPSQPVMPQQPMQAPPQMGPQMQQQPPIQPPMQNPQGSQPMMPGEGMQGGLPQVQGGAIPRQAPGEMGGNQ